ncbi:MAG: ABC transporter permease [Anaerolineae bacterium]|nr:FtsX-like permease family protein [Anaerolineae bacterium]
MIGLYVRRNFRRRRVRTVLMILSLVIGVGTLVTLNATVDSYRRYYTGTVASDVGDFDLTITRPDTAPNPFLAIGDLTPRLMAIPGVMGVSPRIQAIVSVRAGVKDGDTAFVALQPDLDQSGAVKVEDGVYDLGTGTTGLPGVFVLQETADVLDISLGDALEIQYAPPETRLKGRDVPASGSLLRTTAQWEVRGIGTQRGLTGRSNNEGVIVDLAVAQERFHLGDEADRLIVEIDPKRYDSNNPEQSSFAARLVGFAVRDALGHDDFAYNMPRPRAVIDGANQFVFWQSLIMMYGLLSLGVVGLLIRTLIMTNVQEQTRDMAVMRILGAPRRHLFNLVAAEVAAVGLLGIGLGVVVGQLVNNLVVVPLIKDRAAGFIVDLPLVSARAILISVLVSLVVLAISALAPAQRAASTKITNAINPGVADGIGLDDLDRLRERRTDLRISAAGLVILCYPLLVFYVFPLAFDFGILWVLAALIFGALLSLIVGAAMLFFIVILPMERGLLWIIDRLAPHVGYFVRRTVLRGKARNTLISLMIVLSSLLPSFLSTTLALQVANTETDRRLQGGAAFRINPPSSENSQRRREQDDGSGGPATSAEAASTFKTDILDELRGDPAFRATLGRSRSYRSEVRDGVGMRSAQANVVGIDGDPRSTLYGEAIELVSGSPDTLGRLALEPGTAIIGAGLATYLDRAVGDTVQVVGDGKDHLEELRIVAIAKRIGGVGSFTSKQTDVWSGSTTVLVAMDSYRALTNNPVYGPPDPRLPVVGTLLAAPAADQDESKLTSDLRLRYATEHRLAINSTAETIKTVQQEARTGQIFLVVLTALTSILAIFGVFAVIYVSIYGRRAEIGMLKAVGTPGRQLLYVFVGEAMVMTLSATLTGITAGMLLAYTFRLSEGFRQELPTHFAVDPVVVPAMLVLMILSSFFSAVIATHSLRRRRAIDILRTV